MTYEVLCANSPLGILLTQTPEIQDGVQCALSPSSRPPKVSVDADREWGPNSIKSRGRVGVGGAPTNQNNLHLNLRRIRLHMPLLFLGPWINSDQSTAPDRVNRSLLGEVSATPQGLASQIDRKHCSIHAQWHYCAQAYKLVAAGKF